MDLEALATAALVSAVHRQALVPVVAARAKVSIAAPVANLTVDHCLAALPAVF